MSLHLHFIDEKNKGTRRQSNFPEVMQPEMAEAGVWT